MIRRTASDLPSQQLSRSNHRLGGSVDRPAFDLAEMKEREAERNAPIGIEHRDCNVSYVVHGVRFEFQHRVVGQLLEELLQQRFSQVAVIGTFCELLRHRGTIGTQVVEADRVSPLPHHRTVGAEIDGHTLLQILGQFGDPFAPLGRRHPRQKRLPDRRLKRYALARRELDRSTVGFPSTEMQSTSRPTWTVPVHSSPVDSARLTISTRASSMTGCASTEAWPTAAAAGPSV